MPDKTIQSIHDKLNQIQEMIRPKPVNPFEDLFGSLKKQGKDSYTATTRRKESK